MSINNFQQMNNLLNKVGLGRPQTRAEVLGSNKPKMNATQRQMSQKPTPAPQQPKKPGCSSCSRRKQQQQQQQGK